MDRPVIKISTTSSGDPMGILVVENEALKMTIEDLERHMRISDAKLVDAEDVLKKSQRLNGEYFAAFNEIRETVEGLG